MEYKTDLEWSEDAKNLKSMPGMRNYNLNCYANSVMQAIFYLPPVYNHFEKYSCACGNDCVYCVYEKRFFQQD